VRSPPYTAPNLSRCVLPNVKVTAFNISSADRQRTEALERLGRLLAEAFKVDHRPKFSCLLDGLNEGALHATKPRRPKTDRYEAQPLERTRANQMQLDSHM
jgi:hypothetical protein